MVDKVQKVNNIIIGAGITGLLVARQLEYRQQPYIILEQNNDIGGIWYTIAKPTSTLQHNAHYYLLHTYYKVPGSKVKVDEYATTEQIMQVIHEFIKYYKMDQRIQYNTHADKYYNNNDDTVTLEYTDHDNKHHKYQCNQLFVCTGSLAGGAKNVKHWNERDADKFVQYIQIHNYKELYEKHNVKNLVVVGGGSSAVEACLRATRYGVPNITMVYHNHIGVWYNNIFNEAIYGAGNLLPVSVAQYLYEKYSHLLAWYHGENLPPFKYDDQHLYPFSTAFIHAYNKKQIKLTDKLTDELQDQADLIVTAIGFNNALTQYNLDEKKLTNFNTQYPGQKNIHYIGYIHSGAGTIPISARLCTLYVMRCIERNIYPESDNKHVAYFSGIHWFWECIRLFGIYDIVFWYRFVYFVFVTIYASLIELTKDMYNNKWTTPAP